MNRRTVLRTAAYGSKVLNDIEMNIGAPQADMFTVVTFVEKYPAYLVRKLFKLRVESRSLLVLRTYSIDQGYDRIDGNITTIEYRTRNKHQKPTV